MHYNAVTVPCSFIIGLLSSASAIMEEILGEIRTAMGYTAGGGGGGGEEGGDGRLGLMKQLYGAQNWGQFGTVRSAVLFRQFILF